MKKNVFEYLRKKILEHSTITEEITGVIKYYKIECLGFRESVFFPKDFPHRKIATGLLIDKLVENADFLMKLEKIETRKHNIKTLLD